MQARAQAPKTQADAAADFEHAEEVNAHPGHAGGFGPGLVTITSTNSISFPAQQQPPKKLEGRRELETAAAPGTGQTPRKTGPIPVETVNQNQPLSAAGGGFLGGASTSASIK